MMFTNLCLKLMTVLATVLLLTPHVWATSTRCEGLFLPSNQFQAWEQNLQHPDDVHGRQGDPHDQPTFAESIMELAFREQYNDTLTRIGASASERLKRVLVNLKSMPMPYGEGGGVSTGPWLQSTKLRLNSLMKGSPLYYLCMNHEMNHASRSVTLFGRVNPYWNYSFVEHEEALAAAADYRALRKFAQDMPLEQFEKALNDRYIDNRHINRHRVEWHKKGWIDDDGKPTDAGEKILDALSFEEPGAVADRVSADPTLRSYLVHRFDLMFLDQLSLALNMDQQSYVNEHVSGYVLHSKAHRRRLGLMHTFGLLALLYWLS